MSKHKRDVHADAAWQPIGLPTPLVTTPAQTPRAFVHDLSVARARRAAQAVLAPGVILAATLGVASTAAAHNGVIHTENGDIPVAVTASGPASSESSSSTMSASTGTNPTMTTTSTGSGSTTTTTTTSSGSSTGGSGSFLPTSELPGAGIPVVGGFISHAPSIFTGGLFGGETVQTSVDPNQSGGHSTGDTTHEGGGDACDFFLQHMWKNEDGIPVVGTNSHFLTYHTDPSYQNLPLSLFSGAIGNSQMPIIDIYGGPLGWIPIFNPSHVRGHGTDYVTLLTGCGGMGLPIDTKTMSVDLNKLPTPEKALNLATRIMPNVPDPSKILGPDYLYNTLRVDEITKRTGPTSVLTPDEYLSFAGKNFDAFRLLWQTALEKMGSGNPTAVLDAIKITDNIKTLQSLGLPGLPGSGDKTLTSDLPAGGLTSGLPTGDLTSKLPTSSVPLIGPLFADLLGGTSTAPSGTTPSGTTPSGSTPSGTTPSGSTPSGTTPSGTSPTGGLAGIPVLGGILSGNLPTPGSTTPGSTTPGSSSSPLGGLPVIGDLLGGSSPLGGVTGSTPTGTAPSGTTPSGSTPSGSTPSGTTPSGSTPSGSTPTGTSPSGSTQPAPASPSSPLGSLPVIGDLLGGSSPLGGVTGSTPSGTAPSGSTSSGSPSGTTPSGSTPSGTTPSGSTPSGSTPGTSEPAPASPSSPVSSLPVVGGLLGGSSAPTGSLTSALPTGDLLSSLPLLSSKPAPAPSGSTTPGSTTPGSTTPGSTTPGSTTPGSTTPGSTTPGSTTPGTTTPGSTTPGSAPIDSPQGTVAFSVGAPRVNGTQSLNAPGVTIPAGSQVTYTVPVTNTGDVPITSLVGKASDGGTLTGARFPLAPGQSTTLTYTTTAKPGTQSMSFGIVGLNPNGQQQGKSCSAVYTGEVKSGEVATTNQFRVNNQPASGDATYTFTSTDPSSIAVQVTNRGTAPLTNVTGTSPAGPVTGGKTTLAPGESTWFTLPVQPKSGLTTVPFRFTGTDASGKTTTSTETFTYTLCTCGASA